MKRKKKGLWLHPLKRVKLSKDQNESTESSDLTTTNTQTTIPVNPTNYRFSIYNNSWSSGRKRKRRKQLFSKSREEQLVDEITMIIPSVLKTLEKAGLREDFCLLLKGISSGTFHVNNIALRLLLDIAQFGSAVSEGKI
jgi:hypothetical protein